MEPLNDHASRAHALCSASASDRWLHCPGSVKVSERYPRVDTVYSLEGTTAHEVAEAIASGAAPDTIEVSSETGVTLEMVHHATDYRDYIESLCSEYTVKMLEQVVDFSPWVPQGFGTADCILLRGDTMDVIDFKYGSGVEVSAIGNPQMQLYALGALHEYGDFYDITRVRMHIFQPRKDNISVWETDVPHLMDFGKYAQARAVEALGENPSFDAGSHCKFCPHAGRCYHLAKASLEAVSEGSELMPSFDTLTPAAVASVLSRIPMLEAWVEKVKATALADLLNGTDIPGYKVVEGKLGNRKWTNESAVMDALKNAGFEQADFAPPALLGPAGIDKLVGKKKAAELLGGLISREPGKPTVVPAADKRSAYKKVTEKDFEDLKEI